MPGTTTDGSRASRDAVASGGSWLTAGTVIAAIAGLPVLRLLVGDAAGPWGRVAAPWLVLAVVLVVAFGLERRTLAEVGARRPALRDVAWIVLTVVAATLAFAATDPVLEAAGLATTDGLELAGSLASGLALALTAGVVEETLVRGYAFERIAETTWGPTGAAVLTWLAFTLAHVPAGYPPGSLVQIAAASAVFTLVYLRRRTLVPVIVAHAGVDVIGVLAATYA